VGQFTCKKSANGQGLVEYALTIAVVALVAALVLGLIALATNRVFGLVSGTFHATRGGTSTLQFAQNQKPECGQYHILTTPAPANPYVTVLYVEIESDQDIPLTDITVSTEQGFNFTVSKDSNPGQYNIDQPLLAGTTAASGWDDSLCPRVLVVQSSKAYGGQTIFWPVQINDWSTS